MKSLDFDLMSLIMQIGRQLLRPSKGPCKYRKWPFSMVAKLGTRGYAAEAASSLQLQACDPSSLSDDECPDIDWNHLGFAITPTDYMYVMKCSNEENFRPGQLCRYGNIELSPSAGVLNYGQGLFEGMKAYRREEGGVFIFRPDQNALRMQIGADRMCLPSPSVEQFINAVKETALANKRWIPPPGKGSLYIRPLLLGTGPQLGVAPAPEYTFLAYASPVGNYFKEGTAPLNLYVEDEIHRASRGGAGGVKSITNYAPVFKAMRRAKGKGFSDVLYLDSVNRRYIEEASASNIFVIKGNVVATPTATNGTILPGVTRKSIMDIATDLGYQVKECAIAVDELVDADEVFTTGTAVGIASVGSITCIGTRIEYKMHPDLVSKKLYNGIVAIQSGKIEDKRGWVVQID